MYGPPSSVNEEVSSAKTIPYGRRKRTTRASMAMNAVPPPAATVPIVSTEITAAMAIIIRSNRPNDRRRTTFRVAPAGLTATGSVDGPLEMVTAAP